jgi:hypothetical protein
MIKAVAKRAPESMRQPKPLRGKFQVRTEKDYTIRTYTADSYFDAVDLFDNLSKVLPFVQIWQGTNLITEYKGV